ncbi:GcvT family protein [Martelella mediterranea]|uniref:Dimethylglycine dehydrogenase n=1 Tax=Martelella mediterranea TaxID=293089 RepID=A0A4R3NT75_9HYPH|nr:FAD-dependent oxidoreductase [Martelella mediterranea]TCT38808.1 dimethylglycine dehydrogenase [Martelella mediterranea]
MTTKTKALVIGGGVVGVSTLYHLAKKGWDDVVLVERKELTSGSTWHAAGLLPLFNMSYSVGQLHRYSVDLYSALETETGLNVGFSKVSNIRLAMTKDRMDEYLYYSGIAETIGVDFRFLTPEEVREVWPLAEIDGLLGAIQHPGDGYIQPADLTQALAKGARDNGARIIRNATVIEIRQNGDGTWHVETDKEAFTAEHVISCTGNFARRTGQMVGLNIPVIPVEHQYIVTEPHPEILARKKQGLPEMGVLRESDSAWYMREEAGGLLLGPYEAGAPVCYVDGPSDDSEYELFQEDLDRLMPHIETAMARVPAFAEVGIKKVYNGAIAYTPDGNPIVGPAPGLKNFWLNEGHSFGITAAGGAGWQLAEWIVDGEPTIDLAGVDPRRFGPYATEGYLIAKNEEAYANVFTMHYPDEERSAARPLKTSPVYARLKALGGVFGSVYGWERANWYAPEGYQLDESELGVGADVITSHNHAPPLDDGRIVEKWSFRRSNYFEHVGNEVKHVHEKVGILDMTPFAKMEVSGSGARAFLNSIFANTVPKKRGRIALCHLLGRQGGVRAEFTLYEWAPDRFYLVSGAGLETHDHDLLAKLAPTDGSVRLRPLTMEMGVLVLAGPKARDVLKKLTRSSLENADFPWLTGQSISIGAASCHALRVNFVGELGWEIHHPIAMQTYIFDQLMEAGAEFDIKPFGIRAMGAMALEKSYRAMQREMTIEYTAYESGLDRFIKPTKDFIGKEALLSRKEEGLSAIFATLIVEGVTDCDARGSEAIYDSSGALAGRVTQGGFGWRIGKSIALAMLSPEYAAVGTRLKVKILGALYEASVVEESPFDPDNEALRA